MGKQLKKTLAVTFLMQILTWACNKIKKKIKTRRQKRLTQTKPKMTEPNSSCQDGGGGLLIRAPPASIKLTGFKSWTQTPTK